MKPSFRRAHLCKFSDQTMILTNLLKGEDYLREVYQEIVTKTKSLHEFTEVRFIKYELLNNKN